MFLFSGFENVPAEYLPLVLILAFVPILPNLWCIYHAFQREFPTPAEKMAWIGVGIFIPVLGGLIYLIWGRRRGRKAAL